MSDLGSVLLNRCSYVILLPLDRVSCPDSRVPLPTLMRGGVGCRGRKASFARALMRENRDVHEVATPPWSLTQLLSNREGIGR